MRKEEKLEEAAELIKILEEQEETLVFDSFSNEDALELGTILADITKNSPKPMSMRVYLDDIIVFQYTMKEREEFRFDWLQRKYQLIKKTGHSSMHGRIKASFFGEYQELSANPSEYGFGCGGFPIRVKNKGLIGAVCLSGLPDPSDHIYVIKALEKMLGLEAPIIPEKYDEEWIKV